MTTKSKFVKYIKENSDKFDFHIKENKIYDNKSGEFVSDIDTFYELFKKENGESFESLYYLHAELFDVIRCTECGTVVFSWEDERWEPNFRCPICTDYKTNYSYWTKEEIENDKTKKEYIEHLIETEKYIKECHKRRERRNGKYDWEIGIVKIKGIFNKNNTYKFVLECNDITKSYFKGLRLHFYKIKNTIRKKDIIIPLSWSSLICLIKFHMKKI